MLRQLNIFILRVIVNAAALWLAALIGIISYGNSVKNLCIAAIILGLLNAALKPLLVIFTLPAIILTLGLFTVLINGFIVVVASWVYGSFEVSSFWAAMLVGILIGLLNYIVTIITGRVQRSYE
jgi:putative membrane protein